MSVVLHTVAFINAFELPKSMTTTGKTKLTDDTNYRRRQWSMLFRVLKTFRLNNNFHDKIFYKTRQIKWNSENDFSMTNFLLLHYIQSYIRLIYI